MVNPNLPRNLPLTQPLFGQFGNLGEKDGALGLLPFSASTAQRLMAVARCEWILNPARGQDLPTSWRTLYELTKLPDNIWEFALAEGLINPEMERKDAQKLLPGGTLATLHTGDRESSLYRGPGTRDALHY